MKRFFLIIFTLMCVQGFSQGVVGCQNGAWICGTTTFSMGLDNAPAFPNALPISNPSSNPQWTNFGCSQANGPFPYWFFFKVINTGTLGFSMGDTSSAFPQSGFYDWNLWPYSLTACSDIYADILPPLSCNWNSNFQGGTGMGTVPAGGDPANFQPGIAVMAGDSFALMVSNFSAVNYSVVLLSTGSASIGCGGIITRISDSKIEEPRLFPNPMTNSLHIIFPYSSERKLTLLSLEGRNLMELSTHSDQEVIDLTTFDKGVYFLIAEEKLKTNRFKIIKE